MLYFSRYYHKDLKKLFKSIVVGKCSCLTLYNDHLPKIPKRYDYIILVNTLAQVDDVQVFARSLKKLAHPQTRFVVVYFSFLWKPLLDLASFLGLRKRDSREPNWLSTKDIENIFALEGFKQIRLGRRFLLLADLGILSDLFNSFISQLPLINNLCLTTYQVFKLSRQKKQHYSVSVIIPARNEEGNISGILKKIPKIGKRTEVIFVEGNSKDNTFQKIQEEIKNTKRKELEVYLFKQKGRGKADAMRLGFSKAKNELLIILDADLTVDPKELTKFYNAISQGHCDFANGCRLIYPMRRQAMRNLNYLGNKIFSVLFTYILGQSVKDTLCGTKAFLKRDYLDISQSRKYFGNFDPFGDFDLLFGASRLNLKIADIPIKYRKRAYGETNIARFTHGLLLFKMTLFAARKLKFI